MLSDDTRDVLRNLAGGTYPSCVRDAIEDALAEIDRLNAVVAARDDEIGVRAAALADAVAEIVDKRAEIEHLRGELAHLRESDAGAGESRDAAWAEAKGLRAEVERLKAENADLTRANLSADRLHARLKAENNDLRDEVDWMKAENNILKGSAPAHGGGHTADYWHGQLDALANAHASEVAFCRQVIAGMVGLAAAGKGGRDDG